MSPTYDARPWLSYYPDRVPADIDVPQVALTQLLDDSADRFPRRTALAFLGRSISYRKLRASVNRLAAALRQLGVHKGDRVALILPNCPQLMIAFYATLRRGGVVVQHNPLLTVPELHHQLADCGAKVVVTFDRSLEVLSTAARGTAVEYVVVTSLTEYMSRTKRLALRLPLRRARKAREELSAELPDDPDLLFFRDLMRTRRNHPRQAAIDPQRDLAALMYTGGTTGRPKGAMLTHGNLVANTHQIVAWDPAVRQGREVGVSLLPMFHSFGQIFGLMGQLTGGTVVLVPKFDLDLVHAAVRKYRPTVLPGVPPIYQEIAAAPWARSGRLKSVRSCISGAMRLPRETVEAFRKATGVPVVQGYGLTEASPVALSNPLDGNARHVSVGVPVPSTRAKIVSESDPTSEMPVGQAGELVISGPQVFAGYWNQPAETAEVLRDGWLHTGDIAMMSPDGFFTLIDRKRDVIIVDGFNVYPSEVEDSLNAHPGVQDSAVIGIPHPSHGEAVKAYIVPTPGYEPTEKEIVPFCAQRLAPHKVPAVVELRQELPRNMLGKVLRRVLREHG